ncbi:MAG: thiamine pyrophosphate-dependent enzyme [Alkalispirochaeta sp.]
MPDIPVLGDEAVALGAIDAGVSIAYGYPGTPSTEILEYLEQYRDTHDHELIARWCANEKTAAEGAVGVSYAGKRSLVTMKHVGLNVAMDAFINACIVKIHGGLVFAVADDPGMHSSQNEQDTRYIADFARTILLEPRNHQEAYEMTREAFALSERFHVPVVVRLVTRLSHSRAAITRQPAVAKSDLGTATDRVDWMTLPALARKGWARLLEQQSEFVAWSEGSPFNRIDLGGGAADAGTGAKDFVTGGPDSMTGAEDPVTGGPDPVTDGSDLGVITSGLGGNYYDENLADLPSPPKRLHIATYPIPVGLVRRLADEVSRILVIEEGYPYIEDHLRSILGDPKPINGKMDGTVPATGELNPDNVRPALGLPPRAAVGTPSFTLPPRPPQLCAGCPHTDSFRALNTARATLPSSIVTSDIGCYALGALPPHNAVETILCMGASVGMAKGAADAGRPNVVATIGDSTFFHSGIPGLIDAVAAGVNMTVMILDNGTTGMTGGQDTVLGGNRIREVAIGCGVDPDHIVLFDPVPRNHDENVRLIENELAYDGVSVIIPVRECVQTKVRRARQQRKGAAR